jgi:hypothetical protein
MKKRHVEQNVASFLAITPQVLAGACHIYELTNRNFFSFSHAIFYTRATPRRGATCAALARCCLRGIPP